MAFTQIAPSAPPSWDTWTVPIGGGEPTRMLPNASGLAWVDAQHVLFSQIMGNGIHMGIVTSTTGRADEREIYYPDHERAMAHYSYSVARPQFDLDRGDGSRRRSFSDAG